MHQYVVIVFNQTLIFIIYFQMLTVTKLKGNKGAKPYLLPLKLKVCAIGNTQKYRTDGEK